MDEALLEVRGKLEKVERKSNQNAFHICMEFSNT